MPLFRKATSSSSGDSSSSSSGLPIHDGPPTAVWTTGDRAFFSALDSTIYAWNGTAWVKSVLIAFVINQVDVDLSATPADSTGAWTFESSAWGHQNWLYPTANNQHIDLPVTVPVSGAYTLSIGYFAANDTTPLTIQARMNGADVGTPLSTVALTNTVVYYATWTGILSAGAASIGVEVTAGGNNFGIVSIQIHQ